MKRAQKPRPEKKFETDFREEGHAMAREGLARLLVATGGDSVGAKLAAKQIVGVLLRAAAEIQAELRTRNAAVHSVFEEATTWPVTWWPTERDRKEQAGELCRLGFGHRASVNVTTTQQDSPGNIWANEYRKFVERVKAAKLSGRVRQERTRRPDNRAILADALSLRALSQDSATLKMWGEACIRFYEFQFPETPSFPAGYGSHRDWKKIKGGVNKIRERIRDGLKQIAPRV